MNTVKPALSQILATAQLAEMAYNADQTDHKKAAWTKALGEYEQAKKEAETEPVLEVSLIVDTTQADIKLYRSLNEVLINKNTYLQEQVEFLNNQLIEKEEKIKELENSLVSAKSTETGNAPVVTPAVTPAATPVAPRPLVGAAKVAAERAAAKAAAVLAEAETEEAKKNS